MESLKRLVVRGLRAFTVTAGAAMTLSACASQMARVPPRMDLGSYDRIALVTFQAEPSRASLAALATQQFSEQVLAAQSGFELLELGPSDSAVARLLAAGDAPAAAKALGQSRQVPAVFFGRLTVTSATPHGSVGTGGSVNVGATVASELSVRLLSTSTGGTLWRSSSSTSESVGQFSMAGGRLPSISASDPNAAYASMVGQLVTDVTGDFRPTWVKQ